MVRRILETNDRFRVLAEDKVGDTASTKIVLDMFVIVRVCIDLLKKANCEIRIESLCFLIKSDSSLVIAHVCMYESNVEQDT